MAFRSKPYGTTDPFDLFAEVRKYPARDVAARITTPLLILDPANEQFFPGQPRQLHDLLPGEKAIIAFTQGQGANFHCQPTGRQDPQHLLAGAVRPDRSPRLHPGENDDRWLATWGGAGVGIILGLIILVLVPVIPFTEQFAREAVPQAEWSSPTFKKINRVLSAAWGGYGDASAPADRRPLIRGEFTFS